MALLSFERKYRVRGGTLIETCSTFGSGHFTLVFWYTDLYIRNPWNGVNSIRCVTRIYLESVVN